MKWLAMVSTKSYFSAGMEETVILLPLFVQTLPEKDKIYTVYYYEPGHFPGADDLLEGDEYGHACEAETSVMLHIDA